MLAICKVGWRMVVPGAHLARRVLAALGVCGGGWRMVVPGAHLARRVLAALGVCVGYMCWLYVK